MEQTWTLTYSTCRRWPPRSSFLCQMPQWQRRSSFSWIPWLPEEDFGPTKWTGRKGSPYILHMVAPLSYTMELTGELLLFIPQLRFPWSRMESKDQNSWLNSRCSSWHWKMPWAAIGSNYTTLATGLCQWFSPLVWPMATILIQGCPLWNNKLWEFLGYQIWKIQIKIIHVSVHTKTQNTEAQSNVQADRFAQILDARAETTSDNSPDVFPFGSKSLWNIRS